MKQFLIALYKREMKKVDYERIAGMLDKTFAWSVARTFSREEAEELTQEIMFQAIKGIWELRDENRFEPWFWRLADITLKVFKRSKAKIRGTMSFDEVAALAFEDEYDFIADEEYQNLRRKIAQLSSAYRDIIVLHYYDNLSCKAISQKLGLPEGTVTYRLSLARNKIKERCDKMDATALKPAQLKIRITGEGNYNGDDRPFPWQYIDDALSQNLLWHSYREPKTVEELSELTGVPAFFIEDRINNLIKREAVIQPTKKTVQANFLIFDAEINSYAPKHSGNFAVAVSDEFYRLSHHLTDEMLSSGLQTAGRSFDEILCLLSVMLLDKFVPDYRPTEYTRYKQRYDGGRWDYTGFFQDGSCGGDVGIGMEKSMNNYESGKLAHYTYHFAPFAYRKMMFDHEIDVCHAVLQKSELSERQKEYAAKIIAEGYLVKNESDEIVCAIPIFTKEQHDLFIVSVKTIFKDFLPFYAEQVKKYLDGYMKLFPKHLKEATERNGFHVFVALFKAVAADWIKNEKINIPNGAVCDALIMM
jgi:RNA polymerase sigma-70 factor (ECF subfamily)